MILTVNIVLRPGLQQKPSTVIPIIMLNTFKTILCLLLSIVIFRELKNCIILVFEMVFRNHFTYKLTLIRRILSIVFGFSVFI